MILESAYTAELCGDTAQDAVMGCELCKRRVEQSCISEYRLCDDCFRVWEIAYPAGFRHGVEKTLRIMAEKGAI